ncbi:MAG: single-stranded-DNA-specific exonuclease RecJ [Desulfobacteraceae bacterium 4484_190.2]|nr:MAG: single-stranded-DNA-specific exonuclease RecJ [Desulfobacteraceae bacterium 4484_190.2]
MTAHASHWQPTPLASQLSSEAGLTPLQAQLLINRGISDRESVRSFMRPQLADMADPMMMKGMDEAIATILKSIDNKEKITIYGDYDADGLTATALLSNFLSSIDIPVSCYIPNRLNEGYGLNREAIGKIASNGTGLIITVDCGISNGEEISFARSLGLKVVVTDHHQMPIGFHVNCPVINPHQGDCLFPFKDLAGVGVAFFLAVAIRANLRKRGWFKSKPEPDLKEYLDLVALGTVADRVPLLGQNRIIVNSGINIMGMSRWPGINAMKEVAEIGASEITADDLAFRLAPRLNAPGRMGDPEIGLKMLTVRDPHMAREFALEANTMNNQRQNVEKDIFKQIKGLIKTTEGFNGLKTLVFAEEGWHKGVLGIVASRLVDKYHCPSLVFSIQDGTAVGSGRSIDSFNLYVALGQLSHLFERFGGHAHAAGFTLKVENLDNLKNELEALANDTFGDEDLIPTIEVDAEIMLNDITRKMIREIKILSPFGEGNPEPLFCARSLKVLGSRIVGERHLKLRVRQEGKSFEAIGFGLAGKYPLDGKTINMAFIPELNRWNGYERIQLRVIDL